MLDMKMPGFTAETSVYTASERYHALVAVSHQTEGVIHPATGVNHACYIDCMDDCLGGGPVHTGPSRPGVCVRLCKGICSHPDW